MLHYLWVALFFVLLLALLIQFRGRHSKQNTFKSYFSKCKADQLNEYRLEQSCTQKATVFHALAPSSLKAVFRDMEKVIAAKTRTGGENERYKKPCCHFD